MATSTAFESVTLDGVMQSLGRPDEDTRDGSVHGGWGRGLLTGETIETVARLRAEADLPIHTPDRSLKPV